MATGQIDVDHWVRFEERTKDAWRHVVREHGFDPSEVTFPLVIDGDTMIVTEFRLNEQGRRYMDDNREVAVKVHEVKLRTEVGLPAMCREDP